MLKKYILILRLVSLLVTLYSTPSMAQTYEAVLSTLRDIDMNVADTGFEADNERYGFGAQKKLDKDTTFHMGIGAKLRNTPEYDLSNSYREMDSQTNMIEENFDPMKATPMVGFTIGHKF